MIISAIDRSPMPDQEALTAAVEGEFGDDAVQLVIPRVAGVSEFDLNVHPRDDSPFTIARFRNGSVSSDGTPEQNAVVAALVRSLLPSSFPRVVAIEPDGGVYVDLDAGITADEVASGWRDIALGGF